MESNISGNTDQGGFIPPNMVAINAYFISLITIGTLGNLLLVVAFSLEKKLRRVTANFFIAHLAVVNLFAVITITPLYMYVVHVRLNTAAIKFRNVAYPTTLSMALESLAVIGLNRYLLISNRIKTYQRLCTGRAIPLMFLMMWVLTISNVVPLWINYDEEKDEKPNMAEQKIIIFLFINIFPTLIIVPITNMMTLRIVIKSRMRVADSVRAARENPSTTARTTCVTFADENSEHGGKGQPTQDIGLRGCDNNQNDGQIEPNESHEFHGGLPEGKVPSKLVSPNPNQQLEDRLPLEEDQRTSKDVSDINSPPVNQPASPMNSASSGSSCTENQDQLTNASDCDGRLTVRPVDQPCSSLVVSLDVQEKKENRIKKLNLVQLDKPKILRVGRGEIKLMRLMLAMFSLLSVSWIPVLIEIFGKFEPTRSLSVLEYYVYLIPLFPSFVPFVYIWSNIHFQRVLMKRVRLLCTICCHYTKTTADRQETTFY